MPVDANQPPKVVPHLDDLEHAGIAAKIVRTPPPRNVQESARLQGIELGRLIRTLVVRRGPGDYVFVLVPGGRRIHWPRLRAFLGVTRLFLPDEEEARSATGYERGAITPFGAAFAWPVVADATIAGLGRVAIGAGARGVNVHLEARDLLRVLQAEHADIAFDANDAATQSRDRGGETRYPPPPSSR